MVKSAMRGTRRQRSEECNEGDYSHKQDDGEECNEGDEMR